jgi:putative oxidoreductase
MMAKIIDTFNKITDHPDLGRLLLRLVFATLMLFHGVFKLQHGVAWIEPILAQHHLPELLAYGAYIGEVVAPIFIFIGLFTRLAGLIYALNMVFAVLLVAVSQFYKLTDVGAWALETEALYFFGGLIIMLLGAGKYSISRR